MTDVNEELTTLQAMTTNDLCERYRALFGQPVRTRHRAYLLRKLAWRIQALAEGDLSERARRRAAELADDADVRLMPPKAPAGPRQTAAEGRRVLKAPAASPAVADPRLPAPGAAIVRQYKGSTIRVVVRPDGFEYDGRRYKTLSAVAKDVTGSHLNGFHFFRLTGAQR